MGLIGTAAGTLGMPQPMLVEDFGEFLAPVLLGLQPRSVRPEWRTLDVIEHTEAHIHTMVRARDPDAGPPYLKATRVSADEVQVIYTSTRRLCILAEGIARGLAKHFGERITITQPECMLHGGSRCLIVVRLLRKRASRSGKHRVDQGGNL